MKFESKFSIGQSSIVSRTHMKGVDMNGSIREFTGENAFLSNFHPSPMTWRGVRFPTAEHAYQWAKGRTDAERDAVLAATTPGVAKRIGGKYKRIEWHAVSLPTMLDVVRTKFRQNPGLLDQLLATGDAHLEEGNAWGDDFWGTVNGFGRNELGKILMQVRAELRREQGESA